MIVGTGRRKRPLPTLKKEVASLRAVDFIWFNQENLSIKMTETLLSAGGFYQEDNNIN
jgi:hypothetical protein